MTTEHQDWMGNLQSLKAQIFTGNPQDRVPNDFYATDPIAVNHLAARYHIPTNVWEPACGQGHLSKRLIELGHTVISTDLIDRGYGNVADFLKTTHSPFHDSPDQCILTNPPYRYALEFVTHALDIMPPDTPIIMFLRTTFLESKSRYNQLYSKGHLHAIYQFVNRIQCAPNANFTRVHSAVPYAFFIFRSTPTNVPSIYWI